MGVVGGAIYRGHASALLRAAVVVGCAIVGGIGSRAHAQVMIAEEDETPAEANAPKGFAVLKADSKIVEMIEDFDRYSGKKSWELAFHALNAIDDANGNGLVPATNGFLVPIHERVQQSLLHLPPEGREAFRLFSDANAKQLWEHLKDARGGVPADEMETLRKLVGRYFLTSVGDLAADRLGDALFEQGNFAGADAEWRLVVEKYPDSHLSLAKLQAKRCAALALLGRRDALSALVAQVREKYGDQMATIGGREVNVAEYAESLLPKAPTGQASRAKTAEEVVLPTADQPAWQIRIAGPNLAGMNDPQTGMPMSQSGLSTAPCCAVDQKRFYANRLGTVYAADLKTGKMLWRTGKFANFAQEATQILQRGIAPDSFFLTVVGDKLLVGCVGSKNLLGKFAGAPIHDDNAWHMDCLDAATGKTIWSFRRQGMTLISVPYVLNDMAYVAGMTANNSMSLLAIRIADGHTLWLTALGTPRNSNNWRGGINFGGPTMLAIGDELYLATNDGALFGIDLVGHQIQWSFQHDTKPADNNNGRFFWWGQQMMVSKEPCTALLSDDGVFYLKDGSARTLYALDLAEPALKWKRLISPNDSVAAIDGQTAYLLGHEVSALDLQLRKLLWSTTIPNEGPKVRPLICPQHLFVPTARGIFDIDPANGDIRRVFRGADRQSPICQLILSGDQLICISDAAVTAYPIGRAPAGKVSLRTTK